MSECGLPDRVLTDLITIRKPVHSFVTGTKRPVFSFEISASGVKAQFIPQSTALNRNVFGQVPNLGFLLFLNPRDIAENDEVVRESDGKEFVVKEVKDFFNHHYEVIVVEKAA